MSLGARVLIAGGGIAALEGLLAVRDLTGGEAEVTLISPEREFTYRPLLVVEPFSADLADRRDLPSLLAEQDASFIEDRLAAIDDGAGTAMTGEERELDFDYALIAIGARMRPALSAAHTLWVEPIPTGIDTLLDRAAESGGLDLIVPSGVTWPLPLYEFALMARRRIVERDEETPVRVLTPEQAPLIIFGASASSEVAGLLEARGIEVSPGTLVGEEEDGTLHVFGEGEPPTGYPVALPRMEGVSIEGLPADEHGFIPVEEGSRVRGLDRIWAAGDGTSFPVKQGGIATQQADIAAERIAAAMGHDVELSVERPVLRGRLLTGTESISMRTELAGGAGEGLVSSDYLWWPPHKVSGRYLAPLLASDTIQIESEPPARSVDIEVPLTGEPAPASEEG
jgi:sulfide:quinone oxidoreductase